MYISTRRFRKSEKLRKMIREVVTKPDDLILPVFIKDGSNKPEEVKNMPGVFNFCLDGAIKEIMRASRLGINAVVVRPMPDRQDYGKWDKLIDFQQKILSRISMECPDVTTIVDGYFTSITPDGYYGIKDANGNMDLEKTLNLLQNQAVAQAQSGADVVVTLGRVDNSVGSIRKALNENFFFDTPIMSYSANFASTLAHAMLIDPEVSKIHKEGSLKSKIGVGNIEESLRQVETEIAQGIDFLGIKPAIPFLDVVCRMKLAFKLPMVVYIVSKEYSMIKAASKAGYLDEKETVEEWTISLKRAGTDKIISYWAIEQAQWMMEI